MSFREPTAILTVRATLDAGSVALTSCSSRSRCISANEANTEQLFSLAGGLSDDSHWQDGPLVPPQLWRSRSRANRKVFMPTKQAILERYMAKLS